MDKFSKLEKKKPKKAEAEELFDGGYLKIVKKDNWTFLTESDNACVLPILLDENKILVRMEVVTPFKYRDKNDYHLTCISGTIEEGETPEQCIKRELEEEAGIVLRSNVVIEVYDALYKSKTQSSKFHLCVLPLNSYSYDEVIAKGDGSKEEAISKTVEVNIDNIDQLNPSDVVTALLISEAKKFLKL